MPASSRRSTTAVIHGRDERLDDAVAVARTRRVGEGVAFSSRASGQDISALTSAVVAHHLATTMDDPADPGHDGVLVQVPSKGAL